MEVLPAARRGCRQALEWGCCQLLGWGCCQLLGWGATSCWGGVAASCWVGGTASCWGRGATRCCTRFASWLPKLSLPCQGLCIITSPHHGKTFLLILQEKKQTSSPHGLEQFARPAQSSLGIVCVVTSPLPLPAFPGENSAPRLAVLPRWGRGRAGATWILQPKGNLTTAMEAFLSAPGHPYLAHCPLLISEFWE